MNGRRGRAVGASIAVLGLLGVSAGPALASPNMLVSKVSSLKAGATAGTLHGTVVNKTASASRAKVTVRLMRWGTKAPVVGRVSVPVLANGSADFSVKVKLPAGTKRGNYYLSACTPAGLGAGDLGCASTANEILVKGGLPIRGVAATKALASQSSAAAAEVCTPGAHTPALPGERADPAAGHGGSQLLPSHGHTGFDAIRNP